MNKQEGEGEQEGEKRKEGTKRRTKRVGWKEGKA